MVIAGKLSDDVDYSMLSPAESLTKEKVKQSFTIPLRLNLFFQEECADLLEVISDRINSKHPDFVSHLLLSIFKMAEVEIVQVEPSSASPQSLFHLTAGLIVFMLVADRIALKMLLELS